MARLKSARFLARHVGAELSGIVTAITPRGLFVELLRWPVEGFVARDTLRMGSVHLEERVAWRHERSGFELRPGDKVKVVVVRADVRQRRCDFALVSPERGGRKGPSSARRERLERRRAVRQAREKGRGRGATASRTQRPPRAGRGSVPRPPKRRPGKKRG
ncbi:MAG: S1 RNA-binding domain-containing protein [Candidatus Eisenbacteria bacterium]